MMYHAPERDLSSYAILAIRFFVQVVFIVAFFLIVAIATARVIVWITEPLDVHVYERLP
jgi:hypothetical protein